MTDTPAAAEPKKGSLLLKLVIAGCLGCGCLFFAAIAAAVAIPFMVTAPAVDAARQHLTLAQHDPGRTWSECSAGLKASISEAQFGEFVASHPEFYKAADVTFNNRSFENGVVKLTGTATSASGAVAPLQVVLMKDGEMWRVQGVGAP